jgi:hypothetical protein
MELNNTLQHIELGECLSLATEVEETIRQLIEI